MTASVILKWKIHSFHSIYSDYCLYHKPFPLIYLPKYTPFFFLSNKLTIKHKLAPKILRQDKIKTGKHVKKRNKWVKRCKKKNKKKTYTHAEEHTITNTKSESLYKMKLETIIYNQKTCKTKKSIYTIYEMKIEVFKVPLWNWFMCVCWQSTVGYRACL